MNETPLRSGALRTLGRGFWIGLVGSIGLHAALLSTDLFKIPDIPKPRIIEARLESAEVRAATLSEPEGVAKAAKPEAVPPAPPTSDFPTEPLPPNPPASPPAYAETETPVPSIVESETAHAPPLPDVRQPVEESSPHARLSQVKDHLSELPGHIRLVYQIQGMVDGRQTLDWQRDNQRYTLESSTETTGLAAIFLSGKIIQKSTGSIGPLGLTPERYEVQRPADKKETLLFKYDDNLIESSRFDPKKGLRTLELPLLTAAQDPLSSLFQLAMSAQKDGEGFIVIASAKRVKGYPYRALGIETLDTPLGPLQTLHVTRASDSEKGAAHLWLAIERRNLPVRITYTDDDGREWVMEAVSLTEK